MLEPAVCVDPLRSMHATCMQTMPHAWRTWGRRLHALLSMLGRESASELGDSARPEVHAWRGREALRWPDRDAAAPAARIGLCQPQCLLPSMHTAITGCSGCDRAWHAAACMLQPVVDLDICFGLMARVHDKQRLRRK